MLNYRHINNLDFKVLESVVVNPLFDGKTNFDPSGWSIEKRESVSLKRNWYLFEICELNDGRYFIINKGLVLEFKEPLALQGIITHPRETAMFYASCTIQVHVVIAKGFDMLLVLTS